MLAYIKSVKHRFYLVTLSILIIAGLVVSYYNYTLIINEERDTLAIEHENLHRNYTFLLKQLENDLLLHSEMLLQSEELLQAMDAQDRLKLLKLTQKNFEQLKKYNPFLKVMTFRLQDGTALLRLHKPQMYADTLHPSREMILLTNEKQVAHTGFEIGKLAMAYRAVTPVFYENRYIGSLELGVDTDYIIHSLRQVSYLQYGLLAKNLDSSAFMQKSNLPKIDDFYLVKSDPLFTEKIDNINLNKHSTRAICCNRLYAITSDLELLDHKGEVIAKVLLGFDINAISLRTNQVLKQSILFVLITALLLGLIINAGFNFFITQLAKSYTQIQTLNETLEQRVHEEISKNRRQEKHLLHQSRLAQMGEILSMIAHQWRQPLSSINAIITSMKLKYSLKDFELDKQSGQQALISYTQNQLDHIEDTVVSLSEIIDDFKDFYKPTKSRRTVPVYQPVERALSLVEASFKSKQIHYHRSYEESSMVNVHFNELTQVILNLLQNAMEELLENQTTEPMVTIRTCGDEKNAYIEICDNGNGIDKKLSEKIFEPYFSTKEAKNGSGLGLYMSKIIIEEHHQGDLYLKENSEQTCFVISLPKSEV